MPWTTFRILWPAIVAALLPLDLPTLIARLPSLLRRLAALDVVGEHRSASDRSRPRRIDHQLAGLAA